MQSTLVGLTDNPVMGPKVPPPAPRLVQFAGCLVERDARRLGCGLPAIVDGSAA